MNILQLVGGLASAVVFPALVVLSISAVYAITERALFFLTEKVAAPRDLVGVLAGWKKRGRPVRLKFEVASLGWLGEVLAGARSFSPGHLLAACQQRQAQVNRFDGLLEGIGTVSMSFGLLGSVCGMVAGAGGSDPMEVIGLAMGSTVWGLLIAIPTSSLTILMRTRRETLLDQMDDVMDLLGEFAMTPKGSKKEENDEHARIKAEEPTPVALAALAGSGRADGLP